jgi:hypothetical protein
MSAHITLAAGYDWDWWGVHFNYVQAGLTITNMEFYAGFDLNVQAGYSAQSHITLAKQDLPGFSVAGLISVSPTMALESTLGIDINKRRAER